MSIIFKRIFAALLIAVMLPLQALAYDVVNLPNSMKFSEALGIFGTDEIASATICDLERNYYKTLSADEIKDFYYAASNMTVWRKINPTPFRGVCVNFTTTSGVMISYFFDAGIQVGLYGTDNYICYMPAKDDRISLSYLMSEFYEDTNSHVGGSICNVCNTKDFLKLPEASWAQSPIEVAAAKSLLPYEFTDIYTEDLTREQMAVLAANFITVMGNYASMDDYLADKGIVYIKDIFEDCEGRSEAIDQLYALGVITGKTDTTFEPDSPITRQEFAAFSVRIAELFKYISTEYRLDTNDYPGVSDWANFFVEWNIENSIMTLDDEDLFYPHDNIPVQQAVTVLARLYEFVK